MHTWLWGVKYPDMMDALMPLAAQPTEVSGRNWMTRRMMIEQIRNDPDYNDGNNTTQPKSLKLANAFFSVATNGGTLRHQKRAPTREAADKLVDEMLAARGPADANDFIFQYDSSRGYNASPIWSGSAPHCLRSSQWMTSAIHRRRESWNARSSA
jgi:homoserine O-acetyltransferase